MDRFLLKSGVSLPVIVSRSNGEVVAASKLGMKKFRDETRSFLCEGEKLFEEAVLYGSPERVFLCEDRLASLSGKTEEYLNRPDISERAVVLSRPAFEKISTEKSPQGIVCTVGYPDLFDDADGCAERALSERGRAVILDGVRDPGNLGGILRSAAAFGLRSAVLLSCADPFGDRAVRASMGAVFRIRIAATQKIGELRRALSASGRRAVAAALAENAETLGEAKLFSDDVPVIGNEGHGISGEMLGLCSAAVRIPMAENSESLNAGAAAAVILWEYSKA